MKKIALFLSILALALLSQVAFAQTTCFVSFVEESFSLDSGNGQSIFVTVKNNSGKDFFVDLLSFESNGLFSSEQTITGKVFAENYGLIEVKVNPAVFESQKTKQVTAFLTGHLEDGTRCFLEKEFHFMVRPIEAQKEPLPAISFSQEIDATGSGFITVSVENQNDNALEVRIRSANAVLGKTVFYLGAFSSTTQAITVNNASDGEIVYFSVYSENALLEEKFVKIKRPAPSVEPIVFFPEPEPKIGFIVSSYSSKVDMLENKAVVWAEITSVSETPQSIFVELKNLPKGISASASSFSLEPGKTAQVELQVQGESTLDSFNAILFISGEISTSRKILFENKSIAGMEGTGQTGQTGEQGGVNIFGTAFAVLSDNILFGIFAVVIILLVFLLLFGRRHTMYRQAWIFRAN